MALLKGLMPAPPQPETRVRQVLSRYGARHFPPANPNLFSWLALHQPAVAKGQQLDDAAIGS